MEFPARVVSRTTCLEHELGAQRFVPENVLKPMSRVKAPWKAGIKLFHKYLPQKRKEFPVLFPILPTEPRET